MKLSELGERRIIEKISSYLDIGDDAACIRNDGKYLVLSTDVIYEKTHMPKEMTPEQIGKFIASINISDIAAMGAKPLAFLLSCGLPLDMDFERLDKIIKSADKQCKKYGVNYAGGDTKQNQALTLAGFCLGETKKPVMRSGAKIGDVIAVTGILGCAALGFDLLLGGINHSQKSKLVKRALEPEPKVKEGLLLNKHASAMTDLSDGLSVSLYNIAGMSRAGIKIYADKLPASKEARIVCSDLGLNYTEYALQGGGDYELLFAIQEKHFEEIRKETGATQIGHVTRGKKITIDQRGKEQILERKGYEHFKQ